MTADSRPPAPISTERSAPRRFLSHLTGEVARRGVPPWLLATILALPLLLFSIDLGTPSLWDPDEGLAAEVAREMLVTGHWLTPQLNFARYAERPPAYFWVLGVAMSGLGTRNEAAIRLPSVLLAVAGIWLLLAWGWRHLRPLAATFAALVLTTSAGYVAIGRLGIDDAVSGLLLAIALLSMSEPLLSPRAGFPWLFYVALAAATLVFGPAVLILPVLTAGFFVAALREPGRLLALRPFRGFGVLCVLVAPVLATCAVRDPTYVLDLLFEHNLIRFVDPNFDDYHSYTLASFFGIVPLLMLPWGILLPWSLRDALRAGGERSVDGRLYLFAWLAADVAFFLLSAGNLVAYILLALFPLALLTGRALARFLRRPRSQSRLADPLLLAPGALFVAVLIVPFLTRRWLQSAFPMYADKIVFSFFLIPVAVGGLGAALGRNRGGAVGALAACSVLTLCMVYHYGSETVSAYNSMEVPAGLIAKRLPPTAVLVSYGTTSHTLAFYSGRPVRLLPQVAEARPLLNGAPPVALLTKERYLSQVRAEIRRPLYIWWVSDSKKVLLANVPPPPDGDRRILLPLLSKAS